MNSQPDLRSKTLQTLTKYVKQLPDTTQKPNKGTPNQKKNKGQYTQTQKPTSFPLAKAKTKTAVPTRKPKKNNML